MRETPSLKRLADDWHTHSTLERQRLGAELTARLAEGEPEAASDPETLRDPIRDAVRRRLLDRGIEDCLEWLETRGDWTSRVEAEDLYPIVEDTLALAPHPALGTAQPQSCISPRSWIAPCAIGGIVGGPLLGLGWVGALLGATGAVAGLVWMLDQPDLRARWEGSPRPTRGEKMAPGALQRLSLPHLARALGAKAGVQVMRWLLRTGEAPRIGVSLVALRQAIEDDFERCSNLLLLLCWSRLSARPDAAAPTATPSRTVYDAIAPLAQAVETRRDEPERIRELALELVQTLTEEGLTWKSISEGEPYEPGMDRDYETFGHIEAGQPVRTLKPALCAGERVVVPGLLQRVRG